MDWRFKGSVTIPAGSVSLQGELIIPRNAKAIVLFSHGSGSSHFSPRNRMVAELLHQQNLGTLLFDLLSKEEDSVYSNRFDIGLLTQRLLMATSWLKQHPAAKDCRLGYFGASTGAASALRAAAELPEIAAVVSRGGRPDLAMEVMSRVEAAVLLIIGELDYDVLELNQQAFAKLKGMKKMIIVEEATHLFEEAGAMEKVAEVAADWFKKYLWLPQTVA